MSTSRNKYFNHSPSFIFHLLIISFSLDEEEENNALLFDLRDHGDNVDTETNKYREGEEMEELLLKKIDFLQGAIQTRSEQAVFTT